jgi:hypothetical protein
MGARRYGQVSEILQGKARSSEHCQRHLIASCALNERTSDHFIFGSPGPIFGITLRSEGLRRSGPAEPSDDCFPTSGRRIDDVAMSLQCSALAAALYLNCTRGTFALSRLKSSNADRRATCASKL